MNDVTPGVESVSIVIPCYRSERTLPPLIDRLVATMRARGTEFEVLLVVDGSPDDTWHVAQKLAANSTEVEAMLLSRNYGQHNALLAGIRAARFATIVTMDDDLQHRPDELPRLLDALADDLDLVYGVAIHEEHGVFRSFASRSMKSLFARLLRVSHATHTSAFRAFRTRLRDGFAALDGPHVSVDVALSWTTTRTGSVAVAMDHRAEGRSNYSLRALVRLAATMLLGYSTVPLRLVSYLGLLCAFFGLALLTYVLWSYLTGATTVRGFTTLASVIAIFSGAQMLALGIVGEYLARVHQRSMGQPAYVVADETRSPRRTA